MNTWSHWFLTLGGWVLGSDSSEASSEIEGRAPNGAVMMINEYHWFSDIDMTEHRGTTVVWKTKDEKLVDDLLTQYGRRGLGTTAPLLVPALVGKDLLKPIGQVVANFSVLEWLFEQLLLVLTFPPDTSNKHLVEIGKALTGKMRIDDLLDHVKILFPRRVTDAALQEEYRNLQERAHKIKGERNALVHSQWGVSKHSREGVGLRFTKSREWQTRSWAADEVETLAVEIAALAGELVRFNQEIMLVLGIDPRPD